MEHAEFLANLQEYGQEKLPPGMKAEMSHHVEDCHACRELVEHWPGSLPPEGFAGRVMGRITGRPSWAGLGGLRFVPALGAAFALLVAVAAFWNPERGWVEADKHFAYFDQRPPRGGIVPRVLREVRNE